MTAFANKFAIKLTTDVSNREPTDLDSSSYRQHPMSANLTNIEISPVAAQLVRVQHGNDDDNELDDSDGVTVDLADKRLATVMPVSAQLPNNIRTTTTLDIGSVNIHTATTLQRTAIVSRDQLNSRAVIKSSSASAIANNNTSNQKHHKPDAPMLNYIFDSHLANKHRHHDPRYEYVSMH